MRGERKEQETYAAPRNGKRKREKNKRGKEKERKEERIGEGGV